MIDKKELIDYLFNISMFNQVVTEDKYRKVSEDVKYVFSLYSNKEQKYILKHIERKIKKHNYKQGTLYGN